VPEIWLQFGWHRLPHSREFWWSLSGHNPSQTDR
jgi:hypothetical protein